MFFLLCPYGGLRLELHLFNLVSVIQMRNSRAPEKRRDCYRNRRPATETRENLVKHLVPENQSKRFSLREENSEKNYGRKNFYKKRSYTA